MERIFEHVLTLAAGMFLGSLRTASETLLGKSGNEFTTITNLAILDPDYNVVGTGCATATGTRSQ